MPLVEPLWCECNVCAVGITKSLSTESAAVSGGGASYAVASRERAQARSRDNTSNHASDLFRTTIDVSEQARPCSRYQRKVLGLSVMLFFRLRPATNPFAGRLAEQPPALRRMRCTPVLLIARLTTTGRSPH